MRLIVCLSLLLSSNIIAYSQMPPYRVSLDGQWLFKADPEKVGVQDAWFGESYDRSDWQTVEAPDFWEWYPGMANYDGWGWYARTFNYDGTADSLSIHFAGVDDDAVAWINGTEVGNHTGYSDPFAIDVTRALRIGENLIVVQVLDYGGGGGIYKPITLIETKRLDDLLKSEFADMPAIRSADWVKDAVIYEVYLRSFSKEGTLAGLERRLHELKNLGATVLWLMPIHPVGIKNRKGNLGSPYSIQDYYAVNPEFGTLNDFKRLVSAVHKQGMKIIIDLVANHTSWDSKLMMEHSEWFTRDEHGEIIPPNADWTDVADLDYSHDGLWKYMLDMMAYWVREMGIDGFRCDVAELVPTDFWNDARKRLNAIKPVMMLSEGSAPEHHVKAFDISYSWNVYDALEPLLKGKRPVTLLDQIFKIEALQFPRGSLRMRFNTNHDKNAWDAPAVQKYGIDGLKLSAILINTIPGVPLMYTGEEVANDRKLSLFEKVDIDWARPREMEKLYKSLFDLRRNHKALTRGEMIRVSSTHTDSVYAFLRSAGKDKLLVVLNFSRDPLSTTLTIPADMLFPRRERVVMREIFSDQVIELGKENEEVVLELGGYGYKVFVVKE